MCDVVVIFVFIDCFIFYGFVVLEIFFEGVWLFNLLVEVEVVVEGGEVGMILKEVSDCVFVDNDEVRVVLEEL